MLLCASVPPCLRERQPEAFDKGDKVTDKATKLLKALKGRDIPAQGNALGNEIND
jgi:hypothetical protein